MTWLEQIEIVFWGGLGMFLFVTLPLIFVFVFIGMVIDTIKRKRALEREERDQIERLTRRSKDNGRN